MVNPKVTGDERDLLVCPEGGIRERPQASTNDLHAVGGLEGRTVLDGDAAACLVDRTVISRGPNITAEHCRGALDHRERAIEVVEWQTASRHRVLRIVVRPPDGVVTP